MKPRRGLRDELIDHCLVISLRGEARVDELHESEKELGDRGDIGVDIVRSLHLGQELLRGHGLENKRKQSFADVDLASADCDAYSGKALQVEVVPLEPGLRRANVTAHGGARRAEGFLEVGDV